ncbi:MAG: class I SAM-dependent methyltransferase [Boseongicola sp.]
MTDAPNAEEAEYWSGPSGLTWIECEENLDASFASVTDLILSRAVLRSGERVLDIGCGTGAVTLASAHVVGAGGHVLATDISSPLLERTHKRANGLPQVGALRSDAQTTRWPDSAFDVAVSRFGVMFFSDPAAAFANIARSLRPGGRIVFAAWGPYPENPWWVIPQRIASARLGRPPKISPHAPGPMGLSDMDWSLEQFRRGGLKRIQGQRIELTLDAPGTARDLAEFSTRVGPAARVIRLFDATSADKEAIIDDLTSAFQPYEKPSGVHIPAVINLFTATMA